MHQAVSVYLVCLAVFLVGFMLWQYVTHRRDLLNVRNIAIVGFILFQLTSAAIPLWSGWNDIYKLRDWGSTGFKYAAMATAFAALFLFTYEKGWVSKKLARLAPTTRAVPTLGTVLGLAVLMTVLSIGLRFGLSIPYVSIVANNAGLAFAAIAGGLVGWAWAPRLFNPAIAFAALTILGINLVVTLYGVFGRRELVGVGVCFLFGAYYSHFRYLRPSAVLARVVVLAIPPLLFIAAFTSVRGSEGEGRDLGTAVTAMRTETDLKSGLLMLFDGQNVGAGSMWLLENYPDRYEHRHLMTVWYFVINPVPRAWWPEKPMPLSTKMAEQVRMKGVDTSKLNIGPGIIGHAASEGGWYALLIYAVLGGLLLRFFDEVIALGAMTPFVVLPFGSVTGHILGMPRGETSLFTFQTIVGILSTYLVLIIIAHMVERMGWGKREAVVPAVGPEFDEESYERSDDNDDDEDETEHLASASQDARDA